MDVGELVAGVRTGDRRAVARAISLVEDGGPELEELAAGIVEASGIVEDNQWILDLVRGERFYSFFVGNLEIGAPTFARDLARFSRDRRFVVSNGDHESAGGAVAARIGRQAANSGQPYREC